MKTRRRGAYGPNFDILGLILTKKSEENVAIPGQGQIYLNLGVICKKGNLESAQVRRGMPVPEENLVWFLSRKTM